MNIQADEIFCTKALQCTATLQRTLIAFVPLNFRAKPFVVSKRMLCAQINQHFSEKQVGSQ